MVTIANHANISQQQAQTLVRDVQPLGTLEAVIGWGQRQPEPRTILEVVVHGHDCHDVIFEWERGLHLVFETTCKGDVKMVSVWDFRPGADDVLEKRLASGWQPASAIEGTSNLGHVPCPVSKLDPTGFGG